MCAAAAGAAAAAAAVAAGQGRTLQAAAAHKRSSHCVVDILMYSVLIVGESSVLLDCQRGIIQHSEAASPGLGGRTHATVADSHPSAA